MEENESIFDQKAIKYFYQDVLKHLLPNARHKSLYHFGSTQIKRASNINFDLADSNDINLDSKYFYNKKYSFVHYTSIPSLISIIKEKKFRLYNLEGMDDKEEFELPLRNLNQSLNDYEISEIKKNIFCLSMCEEDLESKAQSLSNWRNYGQDGSGACLKLSFNKRYAKEWVYFLLSKVYYDKKYLSDFIQLKENYISFKEKHNLSLNNFDQIFYKYLAFHKSKIYSSEKEIRLLFCQGFNSYQSPPIKFDINKRNEKTSYIELDIEWNWDPEMKIHILNQGIIPKKIRPIVSIEKVILGYRLSEKAKSDIVQVLQAYSKNYNRKIEFVNSPLFENFMIKSNA